MFLATYKCSLCSYELYYLIYFHILNFEDYNLIKSTLMRFCVH